MGDSHQMKISKEKSKQRRQNPIDVRYDDLGEMHLMALVNGWAMVRRPRAMPFVMAHVAWLRLTSSRPMLVTSNVESR